MFSYIYILKHCNRCHSKKRKESHTETSLNVVHPLIFVAVVFLYLNLTSHSIVNKNYKFIFTGKLLSSNIIFHIIRKLYKFWIRLMSNETLNYFIRFRKQFYSDILFLFSFIRWMWCRIVVCESHLGLLDPQLLAYLKKWLHFWIIIITPKGIRHRLTISPPIPLPHNITPPLPPPPCWHRNLRFILNQFITWQRLIF